MAETEPKKTLSDADIQTVHRRSGPHGGGSVGTDVDSDAHAGTDVDTAPATDVTPAPHSDRDTD